MSGSVCDVSWPVWVLHVTLMTFGCLQTTVTQGPLIQCPICTRPIAFSSIQGLSFHFKLSHPDVKLRELCCVHMNCRFIAKSVAARILHLKSHSSKHRRRRASSVTVRARKDSERKKPPSSEPLTHMLFVPGSKSACKSDSIISMYDSTILFAAALHALCVCPC